MHRSIILFTLSDPYIYTAFEPTSHVYIYYRLCPIWRLLLVAVLVAFPAIPVTWVSLIKAGH